MKVIVRLLFSGMFLVIFLFAASCKKKITTRAELIEYIANPNNGLIKTEQIGKIKVELRYKPWQLMTVRTNNLQTLPVKNGDNVIKDKYYFVLSLSAGNKELLRQLPFAQYSEMVQVLAFRMVSYIDITPDDNKPVTPQDCLFLQTYGTAQANQLLLVFEKARLQNAKQLHIKIREFGIGTGDLDFYFNSKNINDLPVTALK